MSMKKNTARRVIGTAMLAAAVLVFTACPREIGLGSAVDTQKPVIAITAPEADSHISGEFTLTGTVSDDLAVKGVTVTFSSTSQSSLPAKTYPAVIDKEKGTWSLSIDSINVTTGLPDSNYEIIATATDTTNKTATAARSVQIDNTAPTVLVTSPSLYGDGKRTKFCSQLEIKGEAYDASKIEYVKIYICNAEGEVVAGPIEADGTNTWSALFSSDDLSGLEDNGTYFFYPVAEDESGNTNSIFYHKADIYGLPNSTNPFPSTNDIGHLDQGTAPSSSCRLSAEDLFTVRIGANADSVAEGSTSEKGYPDFTYQSQADAAILWTNLEGEGASGNIGVGSAIFATIQPPSDNSAILLDTIEIKIRVRAEGDEEPGSWIIQPSTTKQKVGESVNIAIYPKTTDNAETALSLPVGRYEINLSCRTNSNAEIGSSIVFVVQSDAPVIEESAFGDTPSAAFAQGIISGKNGSTTGLSGKFLQSDYSVIPTSNFDSNSLKIVCKDSSGEEVETYQVGTEEGSDILYDPADGSWSLTIPAGSWGAGMGCLVDGTYTYTIEGKMGDISTTITRIVTVDTIQPVVTLTYPADGGVISGTELVFQGNAMDSGTGVTAAYWCIDDEDATYTVADIDTENASDLYFWEAPEKGTWYTFSMPTSFNNTTVDLTGFEEKKYKVFVYAVDGAGYGSELTENTFCLDNSNPELRELSVTVNGLTTNENFQLAGTAWDTNGLESLTVSDGTHTWTSAGTDPSVSLTKKTADPGEDEENWNWSINFATGESTEGIHLDDGSVTFTITAKDVAGKTATASRSVTIDTSKPVMASAALQNDIVKCDESVYNRLSVSASDSGTGLAGVYYQIASSKETVPSFASESGWEALALGGSGWTGNVDFSDKPEGVQYVYVAAKDNVGNKIVKADPLIVTVDKQKPVTTVTGATDTGSTDVTLTVRVTDTNPRQPVITVTDTTGAQMTAPGLTVTDKPSTATYREWEVAVPFSTDAYATDGVYKIFVNEIDANGRMAVEVVHEIRKDTTAPAINRIDAPEAGKTGVNALYGTTYLFRGTAKDTASGLDCAGLAKILYAFTHDDVEPAAADYTALSMTDGTWTLTKDLVSGTADTAEGSLHEGSWSLYVLAEDKAGNRTATPAVCRFDIDMSDPVLSITAPADATQTSYTKENSFVMTGTASDTNSIQSFTVRLGNGSAVPVTVGTDGTWTYTVSKTEANKDQLISAKFTATDVAGKTTEKTVPFYFDTQAPSVTITLPAANETTINNVYTLTGTVADTGAGVDTATASYIIKKGSTEVASGALSVTGTSWRADDVSLGTEEGLLSLTVSITDNLGWSTEVERNFYYDQSNPELRVLSISANGFTATDDFQLAGTAWDTNELESITVSDGTTTWTSTGASPAVTLTKKTADPGIEEADWNWGITFGTGESTSGVHIADGTTTFTITVKDVAGKSVSATRTVTVDTIHPAITEASVQNAMVKLDESVYNRFTVTASDPAPAAGISGTGLAGVYYKLVTSNAAAPSFASESGWEALALGSDGWTGNVDFTGKAEGTHYIYVAAKDNAGNKTVTETPVTVTVDAYKPVISATGASDASAADVNLTVRVTDTNPSEPQVKILDEGNNELTVNGVTLTAGATTASYKEWTLTVPFSTATYAEDGVYTVIINETDTRGRTAAAVTHPIRKDTTAPAVNVIGTPSTDTEKTGVNALYGTTYVFRGTAKDKDDGTECSGLAKILYAFTQAGTAPALADYTEQAASDGNWSISKTLNSGKSAETGTDNLYEGSWRLYVLAEDKAGNRSATPAVRAFDIDMSAPVLEISKADGTALTDLTKTYYTDGDSVVFEGLASDTNGIQSLTVKIDDGTAVPVTVGTDGNWTYTAETVSVTADRLHTAEFLITDVAGKTTDMSVPFYFDTQAPSVTITLPAANETTINNTYTLSGTVADTGVGVDADNATYIIRKGSTTVASGALTVTGASWRAENVSLGTGEGELSLTVTIKDKLGWSTDIVRTFYYDLSNPELREFSVSANGLTANDDFQLAGTAWDTNELDCITVSDGTNTWTSDGASPAVSLTKKTSDPGTAVADRNWHIDFGVGSSTSGIHISDGTTTFTITVKDVAGKMSSLARTVTVDTTAPSISSATVQNAMTKLDESVYNRLTVTATDPDPSTGVNGTGLAGVYYKVVSTNTAPAFTTDSGWESLALGSDGWTGNVDFSGKDEGTHYIFTAAKDNAGNRTVYGTAASVVVDKQKPVIAVSGAADAGATNVLLTVRVTDTNPVAPVITVLDTDGNEMDEPGLSIEEVTVVATYKEWTVTVPFSSSAYATDGVYSIVVNETDTRGRAATAVTKTIRRDTTAPAVNTIDGPVAGKTGVNALYGTSYLFQGTAKDLATGTNCAGLAKIWYAFTNSSTAPTAGPGADGTPYVEMTMTDGSWTISKTLNTGTSATGNLYEGKWYLYVLAEDKAGNRSSTPVSRAFDIDMSAPSLSITSPTGTYTAGANVIISGTASDTNGIAVNGSDNKYVTVRVGSAAPVEATVDEYGNWSYTYEKTDDNKDQLLTATVTVTDTVGKTTEKEVQIYFDSQSPTITIVEPGDGEVKTSGSCTVSGTISDIGSGIAKNTVEDIAEYAAAGTTAGRKAEIFNAAKATYVIKSGESTVAKGLLTITGSTWSTGTVALGNDEGTLDITITMKDGVGNESEGTRSFYYDKALPVISETGVGSNLTTGTAFTFSGTASDTNALYAVNASGVAKNAITISGTKSDGTTAFTDKTIDVAANGTWTQTFTPGTGSGQLADGTYSFTFTVKDVANRTKSTTRNVTIDTVAPTITAASASAAGEVPAGKVYLDVSGYKQLTVTANDDATGTGLAGVYYKVQAASAAAPTFTSDTDWTSLALGSSGWTANIDFSSNTEGDWKIYVAAKDNAGNRTLYTETVDEEEVAKAVAITVDATKPVITVEGASDAKSENVVLTVHIADTNPATPTFTVKEPKADGSADGTALSAQNAALTVTGPVTEEGGKKWTVTVPFGNANYNKQGVYSIVVNETDTRGRAATAVTKTIRRDTTAPAVNTIDGPVAGKTGVNALYGTSYLFQGTAKDLATGTNCAGLAKIWYAFTNSSTAPTAGPGADGTPYVEMTMTDGSWTISKTLNEGTSAAATGNLYEGKWYLYVLAEDKAGNRSSTPVSRAFDIDMSAPSLSITAPTGTYTAGANVIISGTASDTNGIALNGSGNKYVTVRVGSAAPVEATVDEYGNWSYTYEKTDDNKDQLLTAAVTVTDTVGKTATSEVQFFFDTQNPTVTIVEPGANELKTGASCTISGTVSDTGSGVAKNTDADIAEYANAGTTPERKTALYNNAKATYIIRNGGVEVSKGLLTITGSSWRAENVGLGAAQGTLEVTVNIKDGVGNTSGETRSFYYDTALPVITETGVGSNLTTGVAFTFSGTASDTNALYGVNGSGVAVGAITISATKADGTAAFDDVAVDVAADGTWTKTFTPGTGAGQLEDGTYSFIITVKDKAERTKSTTSTVTVDTALPVISGAAAPASGEVPANKVYLDVSKYRQLTVTASDVGTGLAGVYYKVQSQAADAPTFTSDTGWTSLALGESGWTANIDFTGKAEDIWKIYVAAKDNAGNRALYTVDGNAAFVTVTVDEKKPVITVDGASDAKAEAVALTVHIADTNPGTPTFTVIAPKADGTAGGTTLNAAAANLTVTGPVTEDGGKKWTVTVPFDTYTSQGIYSIVVNETDANGRAADQVTKTIRRDTAAPAVNVIDAPPAGKTGTDALYGTTYIFRGTAKDLESGTDCAGLAKVWYVFTHDATAPADLSAYTALTTTDGPWSLTMNLNAGNADAADDDDLYEGSWYLYVLAEDAAGNRTPVASAASCQFDVDMSDPALTVTVPSNAAYKTIGQTTYIKKAASGDTTFVMNGTVVETNGTPVLTVQIGEAAAAPVTLTADAAHPGTYTWTYTVTMTNANKDQLLTAAFLVTDAAGKTKDKAQQFFFDTQAPSVTITLPAENEITKNSSYSISGTVADTGAGIDASAAAVASNKAYVIKKGSSEIASGALSITGASWSAEVADLGSLEGDLKLIITIKDVLGQTTSVERSFFYDKNNPVLTETGVGSSLTTNEAFIFTGTASDTNVLAGQDATGAATGAITITAVKDGGTTNVVNETVNVAADGSWSKTFTPGSTTGLLADGRYSFTVTVKDSAGRTTSKYSEVVVDTVAPVIAKSGSNTKYITTASVTDSSGNVWYKDASLTVQATVTDNNEVAVTEYAVSTTSDSDWTEDSIVWHSMTRSSTTWTGEVPVSDGDSYICIRAKDAAGNMSYISAQEHAVADLTAPFSAGVFKEAARTTVVNTILTNAAGDLELYIDTDDLDPSDEEGERRGSGAAEVRVKLGNSNMREGTYTATAVSGTPGLFKLTFTAANLLSARNGTDRTVVAYADFKDVAGNRSSASPLFSLKFDTTAPVIEFTSPSSTATVNKTITVTGKTTEVQTLESVKLYYHPATGDDVLLQTFSSENLFNWTYSLNTATYVTGTGNITLKVVAKDEAGNTGNESVTFAVDQSKDCSEITINNIAFNANAQTEEPAMSEANPKWLIGSTTIYGSVTDDDGVKKLEYSKNGTSWEEVTVNNGAFTLTLDTDGTYRIWFKVTDKAGATFTSAAAAALDRPVLKGSDGGTTADSKLYLTVDTTNPLSDVPLFSLTGADNSWTSDLLSQKIFGKDADCKTFYVRQFVYDANDIKKVEVSIDTGSYAAATFVTSGGAPVTKTIGGNTYKAYQYQVPASVIAAITVSGNHTVNIKVTDNAGMSKETNATFTVDNTAPTIAITSHADGDRVDNNFFLSGNTSDAPSNAGATNLVYLVSSSETRPSDSSWTAVSTESVGAHTVRGNLASWRVYFDDKLPLDDGYTHDKILKRILVSTSPYSTYLEIAGDDAGDNANKVVYKAAHAGHTAGTLYKELTTLYIHFKATDANNNVSYAVRSVEFDPQGDIPVVAISYPGASGYGWVNGSTTFFTEEKLPEVGSLAYDSIENMTVSTYTPEAVTAINRTAKTITVNSTAYTYFGGVTVQGGIIRVQGTAEGLHPIDSVYIQIDPTYSEADGFQWDATGNALLPDGTTKLNDVPGDTPSTTRYPIETVTGDTKGIKVSGSAAWSISLNRASEFNAPSSSTTRNSVAIRAIAKDNAGNISPASDVIVITIDADTPRIGTSQDLYLYQYEKNTAGTGAVTASQKYVEGMWLKGEWWIKGSIEDSSDINSIDVNGVSVINDNDTDGYKTTHHTWGETGSQTKGYILEFKIGSSESGFGSLSYTIHAEDKDKGGSKTVTKTITVNYDNEAPELLYPYNNQGQKVSNYNIGHDVVQSNGFYTLKSTVTEQGTETTSQSGFERVALYFVRPGSTAKTGTLYDPFLVKTATGNKLTINLNSGQTSDVTYADGLYWKTKTVGRDANSLSTITLSADDANIHRGGLVKIGGTIYTITQKTGTTLTISGSPVATETTANFAIAMVVDHALTESNGITKGANGYYTDVVNDDGDGMVEAVTSQGSTTYWEANINSRNIPDGKIEIHYVAFDKAGNYSCGVVGCDAPANYKGPETVANLTYDWIDADHAARVANNAPRLAGVRYGTDDNGDGTVADDELITDLFAITGTGADRAYTNSALQTSYLLGTKTGTTYSDSVLKIKGATKIVPEIVGGNNELYYSWSVTKSGQSAAYYEIGKAALKDGSGTAMSGSDYSAEGTGSEIKQGAITLPVATLLKNIGTAQSPKVIDDGANQLFTFTIWDSTEGTEADSQKAKLEMVADVMLKDTTPPDTKIVPLYWKSLSDNSVLKDTSTGTPRLLGHIDLGSDIGTLTTGVTGIDDADDKISGSIIIEGTASDNVLLTGIYMKLYTGTNPESGTNRFVFTDVDTATLKNGNTTIGQFYKVASRSDAGVWTTQSHNDSNGNLEYAFSIVTGSESFSQETGHSVKWQLKINTEKLTATAIADLKLAVLAQDRGSPTLGANDTVSYTKNNNTVSGTKTGATMTNYNQFDVVPYITGISTRLSTLKKNNPSVYNRTTLGHYTVGEDEKVTKENNVVVDDQSIIVTGFNLTGSRYNSTSLAAATEDDVADYYKDRGTSFVKVDASTISASGGLQLTVNSIPTLNNVNNNNAKGSAVDENGTPITLEAANYATYAYNRQPNGDNNQELTDDVIIDVWSINKQAAVARDGGSIDEPVMKINPKDGTIGLAFASGSDSFCLPDGTGSSYLWYSTNYANFANIAFDYDENGDAYGICVGLDTNAGDGGYGGRMTLMSSLWKRGNNYSTTYHNFSNSRKLRLESIGLPKNAYAFGSQLGDYHLDTKRFSSPTIGVTAHESDNTTTRGYYLAYYDRLTGQIRFRSGSTTATTKETFGQFIDNTGWTNGGTSDSYVGDATGSNDYSQHRCFEPLASTYSLIAGAESTVASTSSSTGFVAGNYVALDVVPGTDVATDVVVVVFSDGKDLWYVARKGGVGVDENVEKGKTGSHWTEPKLIFEKVNRDCTIKVGPDGSIHIAAYDHTNGCLKYAYIPAYDEYAKMKTATIDSYGITGSHVSIDVVKEGSSYVPYLSYFMPSTQKVKMAYLTKPERLAFSSTLTLDGVDSNDVYTGVWETAIIPTESSVNDDNTSIGFAKGADGSAKAITSTGTAKAEKEEGLCLGNGKSTPAIAYGTLDISKGFIEVVQMK